MNDHNNNITNSKAKIREFLHQTALKAPNQSGVYLWRNESKTVIYVGKAKSLKNRLTSYFSGNKDIKTQTLIKNAVFIEYITTSNEYEAFILENNLIKKYSPKYNICLKDGKSYPVLKITKEKFPKIFKTRRVVQDGSLYFGPFPDAAALDTFLETLYEIYPLRHCKTFRKKDTPCLYYHINKCIAPCCRNPDENLYSEFIEEIRCLLENKGPEAKEKLKAQMKEAAAQLKFEKAARIRDGLKALLILQNQNIVESFDNDDRDYIASWRESEMITFVVLKMRGGKLLGRDNYRTTSINEDTELLPEFLNAYYTEKEVIPPKIYLQHSEGTEFTKRWIKETYGLDVGIVGLSDLKEGPSARQSDGTLEVASPETKPALEPAVRMHIAALNMAQQNAREDIIRWLRERGDFPAMAELKEVLGLPRLPVRIEGFDIAHIGGKFPVASLISFLNGNPDKKNYRYFRLKTTDGLIDDFQSMREACTRRYTRLLNEGKELPDLILIDGGIGQVNAVQGVLDALDLDIPIAGLAKRDEEIWRPDAREPVCLPKRSDALRLLQRVRDETHRFATSRNQELRTKENTISPFSKLPGVGEKRDKILMKKYGTLENLSNASESDVAQVLGIKADAAAGILLAAKDLFEKQAAVKEKEKLALGQAGTTKEKAARRQELANLAMEALD